MNLSWLQICAEGQTADCVAPIQVAYLVALIIGAVLLAIIGRRSRDFTTSVLSLMAVAIAINIAVGSIIYALRLPIYLDSIGTVLVGALAGPWAGALTGILSNLIWSILPIPGGASPTAAFFAPVAGVIGLMAGFWASRGVFQFRSDDARAGGFLSLAAGFAAAFIALQIVQSTIGLAVDPADPNSQNRFVVIGVLIVLVGVAVAWLTGRTVFDLKADDPRIRTYLIGATAISAFVLIVALFRLAVRADRLLLVGQRQGSRRRWAARPVVRWRRPELPRHRRPCRADRRDRARPRSSGSWRTRGPAAASMPGSSRSGSAGRRPAWSRR